MKIIGHEHNNIGLSSLADSSAAKSRSTDRASVKPSNEEDHIDTSRMGHMMSKNARDITVLKTVRQEKIEAFKHLVEDKPIFSDEVIDKIIHRLTST